jgi:hypothetical protein
MHGRGPLGGGRFDGVAIATMTVADGDAQAAASADIVRVVDAVVLSDGVCGNTVVVADIEAKRRAAKTVAIMAVKKRFLTSNLLQQWLARHLARDISTRIDMMPAARLLEG